MAYETKPPEYQVSTCNRGEKKLACSRDLPDTRRPAVSDIPQSVRKNSKLNRIEKSLTRAFSPAVLNRMKRSSAEMRDRDFGEEELSILLDYVTVDRQNRIVSDDNLPFQSRFFNFSRKDEGNSVKRGKKKASSRKRTEMLSSRCRTRRPSAASSARPCSPGRPPGTAWRCRSASRGPT